MNTRSVRLGIVGAGKWGMNLVRAAAKLGVLTAVCDADLAPLEQVRSHHDGVRIFVDFQTMLANTELDGVVIASPAPLHARLAIDAIRAGLGVLVEKPLALTVQDAQAVADAAREYQATFAVGHLLLYHPAVQTMLRMIADGKIGNVRHVRSRRLSWGTLRKHEDVWWSFAPHDISVMLEVMGEEPSEATYSSGAYVRPHIADVAYADFRFSLGRTAHVEVAWLDPEKSSRIDVFGSEGVLTFVDSRAGATLALAPCGDRLDARGEPELWRGEPQNIDVPEGEPLTVELAAFCRALREGGTLPSNADEALAVVRTLARVHERIRPRASIGVAS